MMLFWAKRKITISGKMLKDEAAMSRVVCDDASCEK
jgi:hypothetical protein